MIDSLNIWANIEKNNKKSFNSTKGFNQLSIIDSTDKNGVSDQDE